MRAHPEIRPSSIAMDLDRGAAIFHACFSSSMPPAISSQRQGRSSWGGGGRRRVVASFPFQGRMTAGGEQATLLQRLNALPICNLSASCVKGSS